MKPGVAEHCVAERSVAENCFPPCSAALPYPAIARIRSAFELALGFKQLRPAQARHWPRAHSCSQAVIRGTRLSVGSIQGMLEVATQEKFFRPQNDKQTCHCQQAFGSINKSILLNDKSWKPQK
jgi:hypothetical protein